MIKTLIIEPAGGLWGSERALLDLIKAAVDLDVAVCCPPNTPLCDELGSRGVTVFPWFIERLHEKSRWRRFQAALGVLRACLAFRPDVIHINQAGAYRVALVAAAVLRLPVVCHVRIFEDAAYLARCHPSRRRLRSIIAISKSVGRELRKHKALDAIPVTTIYDAYIRQAEGGSAERVAGRIACVGRVTPIKGQAILLQAMTQDVAPKGGECLIIGNGDLDYVSQLKAQSPPGTRWLGFVNDVTRLLSTCAVLACPSHREPLGRVIFEAWDAGAVPVVFAGAGGAAEAVAAAGGGLLYKEQSPSQLAQVLTDAIALGEEQASNFIHCGRAWLEANCAPGPYGRAMRQVLADATA